MRRKKAHDAVEITAALLFVEATITVIMKIERYESTTYDDEKRSMHHFQRTDTKTTLTTHLVRVDPTSVRTIL